MNLTNQISFRPEGADWDNMSDKPHLNRLHCLKCGSFLTAKPTGVGKRIARADYHYERYQTDTDESLVVDKVEYEDVMYWECKRCKHKITLEDIL